MGGGGGWEGASRKPEVGYTFQLDSLSSYESKKY